jgi:hypothetical protein
MRFGQVAAATNEAELAAAKAATPAFEAHNLQGDVAALQGYVSSGGAGTQEPFVADPNAWQNMPFLQFVKKEYSRPINFWVLMVGPLFFMYLVYAPARAGWFQDEEKMSKSLYIQQLKGLKSMHLPGDDKH